MTDTTERRDGDEVAEGLASFFAERYTEAADHFQNALKKDPGNPELDHLLAFSSANAISEVDVAVPPVEYFDRGELLAPPPDPGLPSPPSKGTISSNCSRALTTGLWSQTSTARSWM